MEKAEHFTGLSREEVKSLKEKGLTNHLEDPNEDTISRIILKNICTFFNFIIFILALLVLSSGQLKNLMFVGVAFCNLAIGIFQEIKAKLTLDRLSLISESKVQVIRDGQVEHIAHQDIVLGDFVCLKSGNQIVADSKVLDGYLEVNESLLTGEADIIEKRPGDMLYSGSYVISGTATTQVIHVGKDNISSKIMLAAKTRTNQKSSLENAINHILKLISILLVPLGILLFATQYFWQDLSYGEAIIGTVASVSGMIPEGLVLLTSIALAIGAINLARQNTLIHDLFCIETLAHVDVLCLDKTGTLTEGKMSVDKVIPIDDHFSIDKIMPQILGALTDDNATNLALKAHFGVKAISYEKAIPFSSDRKYSAVFFSDHGYFLGAPERLFAHRLEAFEEHINRYTRDGKRILVLARSNQKNEQLPTDLTPLALIVISDVIRKNAKETLTYFEEQGVDLRIISGDHPQTVSLIAKKAGLANYANYIDATTLCTEKDIEEAVKQYTIFGRVTPLQKRQIVQALQKQGHTVGMTGDGVNDVMALKVADCSIAMSEGSDAAKEISNIVLLDSNFEHLPHVLSEGRKVIHHIQNAASLFLVKTIFSIILAFMTLVIGVAYPFVPIQLTFVSTLAVGIPSFFLTLERDYTIVKGDFYTNVLARALPGALAVFGEIVLVTIFTNYYGYSQDVRSTMCVLLTALCTMLVQKEIYPLVSHYRRMIFTTLSIAIVVGFLVFHQFFEMVRLDFVCTVYLLLFALLAFVLIRMMRYLSHLYLYRHQ